MTDDKEKQAEELFEDKLEDSGEGEDEAEGAERHGNGVGNTDYAENGPDFPDEKVRRMIRQFGESSSRIPSVSRW